MLESITGFFDRSVLVVWDIVCWIASTSCSMVEAALKWLGWALAAVSAYYMFYNNWETGLFVFLGAIVCIIGSEFFKLVGFWLSDTKYTVPPAAFVRDITGTLIGFVVIFGSLVALWHYVYSAQWLLVAIIVLAPISFICSFFRFLKSFMAMVKDKLAAKPK